jgi:hypothetical protein
MPDYLSRDRLAVLAGVVAPLALAAVLVPFRGSCWWRAAASSRAGS